MLSIAIPIYNEAGSVGLLYEKVRTAMEKQPKPWELILVNDGSTDGSDELLDELAAKDARVKIVHFRRNFGQTAAMMAGFDFAQGEIIIPMDGDLQNDPEDIPLLLAKLDEGFDVVSGWRKDRQDHAIKRNAPSIMANRLISWVSGVRLHDFGCSLKAYRREVKLIAAKSWKVCDSTAKCTDFCRFTQSGTARKSPRSSCVISRGSTGAANTDWNAS
jgi:glycosyltransferase involved in cell wall biosynthesis